MAIVVAVPLGIAAARRPALGRVILRRDRDPADHAVAGAAGLHDPAAGDRLGAGDRRAVPLQPAADRAQHPRRPARRAGAPARGRPIALGLRPGAALRLIELPLASPSIIAGIKTSAVINVGTATLGALIGAGGYGQPILTGIRLDDLGLILEGAIPAALLALGVERLFDLVEKLVVPRGLRLGSSSEPRDGSCTIPPDALEPGLLRGQRPLHDDQPAGRCARDLLRGDRRSRPGGVRDPRRLFLRRRPRRPGGAGHQDRQPVWQRVRFRRRPHRPGDRPGGGGVLRLSPGRARGHGAGADGGADLDGVDPAGALQRRQVRFSADLLRAAAHGQRLHRAGVSELDAAQAHAVRLRDRVW